MHALAKRAPGCNRPGVLAYVKAWSHGGKVSTYAQPASWVRQVATRLAVSRWRRNKVAATWLARNRQRSPAPPPDETTTALVGALQPIPEPQRRAIVLRHLADLPVAEVARIEHSPVGTAKARRSSGRDRVREGRGAVRLSEVGDRAGDVCGPPGRGRIHRMTSPATGPGAELGVDPAQLTTSADILDAAAGALADSAPGLRRRPDAGVSSDEVATALAALAAAVGGIAEVVRGTADGARTSAADYSSTDQAVHGSMHQRRRSLVE